MSPSSKTTVPLALLALLPPLAASFFLPASLRPGPLLPSARVPSPLRPLRPGPLLAFLSSDDAADDFGPPFGRGFDGSFDPQRLREDARRAYAPHGDRPVPETVHIVMFNPRTDDEGVHTLEYPVGSGRNVLLAFESPDECAAFALALRKQNFHRPEPQRLPLAEVAQFCASTAAVEHLLVPAGTHLAPPSENKTELDFDPEKEKKKRVHRSWLGQEEREEEKEKEELRRAREQLERLFLVEEDGGFQ
uniref:Uncharacterized protein n=1 Tax=Corethron hystrix TaxID=216773 RepID=A0A7S1BBF2_9STRA